MIKDFKIKPPIWPRELTFQEFRDLNPQINENQLIHLYNQYLGKFLEELRQQNLHFKQALNNQLVEELRKFADENISLFNLSLVGFGSSAGRGFNYAEGPTGTDGSGGIGSFAVGTFLSNAKQHFPFPVDNGFPRFTVS
jgi:hypothetical protein